MIYETQKSVFIKCETITLCNTIADASEDFIKKVEGEPKLKVNVSKAGDGWNWEVNIGEMKMSIIIKVGEAHSVGEHAPNYKVRCVFEGCRKLFLPRGSKLVTVNFSRGGGRCAKLFTQGCTQVLKETKYPIGVDVLAFAHNVLYNLYSTLCCWVTTMMVSSRKDSLISRPLQNANNKNVPVAE